MHSLEVINKSEIEPKPWAVLIAGPTASGKSALALHIAQKLNGAVINADSMQIYRELRILTARPSLADEALCQHYLYGVLPAHQNGSVAWWRNAAIEVMNQATSEGKLPILCGGTGLYFQALIHGLALIPDPKEDVRSLAREILAEEGSEAMHARLVALDPESAARLHPSDGQRIARAWEVKMSTGRSIIEWQTQPGLSPAPYRFIVLRLDPSREVLMPSISHRFQLMIEQGAIKEVENLRELGLPSSLPVMRAHGVPELGAYLDNEISLEQAAEHAVAATLRYTKRQKTWFRHHILAHESDARIFSSKIDQKTQEMKKIYHESISFIIKKIDEL